MEQSRRNLEGVGALITTSALDTPLPQNRVESKQNAQTIKKEKTPYTVQLKPNYQNFAKEAWWKRINLSDNEETPTYLKVFEHVQETLPI